LNQISVPFYENSRVI